MDIYFIFSGKVRLYSDLNAFIEDEDLGREVLEQQKKIEIDQAKKGESLPMHLRPSMRAVIQYVSGGYFGDSDLFRTLSGNFPKRKGRDLTAIGDDLECIIFVMKRSIVLKIKDNFEKEYLKMMNVGIKKFKNHQCLIEKEHKRYQLFLKDNLSEYEESHNDKAEEKIDEDSGLDVSLDSIELEKEFQQIKVKQNANMNGAGDEKEIERGT